MAESEQRSWTSGQPGSVGLLEQPLGAQLSSQECLPFFRVLGESWSRKQRLGLILFAEGHVQAGHDSRVKAALLNQRAPYSAPRTFQAQLECTSVEPPWPSDTMR